jgi:hypothetical protein
MTIKLPAIRIPPQTPNMTSRPFSTSPIKPLWLRRYWEVAVHQVEGFPLP